MDFLDDFLGDLSEAAKSLGPALEHPDTSGIDSIGTGIDMLEDFMDIDFAASSSSLSAAAAAKPVDNQPVEPAAEPAPNLWGHWRTLTPAQKAYRGARMREAKAQRRFAHSKKGSEITVGAVTLVVPGPRIGHGSSITDRRSTEIRAGSGSRVVFV